MKDDNNKRPTGPNGDDGEEEGQGGQERPTALDDDSSAAPSAAAGAAAADTGEEEGSSRGDPRMRRACLARIANPSLTLIAALKIGGFTFQQENPNCEDFDDDGVRLRQRKNQLCVSNCKQCVVHSSVSSASFLDIYFFALWSMHFFHPLFLYPFVLGPLRCINILHIKHISDESVQKRPLRTRVGAPVAREGSIPEGRRQRAHLRKERRELVVAWKLILTGKQHRILSG